MKTMTKKKQKDDAPRIIPDCPGSGRRWGSGTGAPICPVCRRGPGWMCVPRPRMRLGRWSGKVPPHAPRAS